MIFKNFFFFYYSEQILDSSRFYDDVKRHFKLTLIILYVGEKLKTSHTVSLWIIHCTLKS